MDGWIIDFTCEFFMWVGMRLWVVDVFLATALKQFFTTTCNRMDVCMKYIWKKEFN